MKLLPEYYRRSESLRMACYKKRNRQEINPSGLVVGAGLSSDSLNPILAVA